MSDKNSFNENILKYLDSFFSDGRCPHALLIDGGSEDERTALGRLAAKMMVCENPPITPCGDCEHCRKAGENIHPDIVLIKKKDDRKSYLKEDVKKIVADAFLTPNEAVRKVFIISEMQQMNEESQNVLLKILEEPPAYTAFVLTAENANAIIGTVLSRVVRLRLEKSAKKEYSDSAREIVSRLCASLSAPYEYDRIAATAPMDGNKALTAEVLDLLLWVVRDGISLKNGGKALSDSGDGQVLARNLSLSRLLEMYDTVSGILRSLDNNPNYTLLTAVLCAKL